MPFSVIIPTWNEEAWLPALLRRLVTCPHVAEIIVADHASEDATAAIAKAGGCRIIAGGRPATARNNGARAAARDLLLFVDADVAITAAVLAAADLELSDRAINLVHFRLIPLTDRGSVRYCYRMADRYVRLSRRIGRGQGSAPLIAVRRSAFLRVGGYDPALTAAEDVDLIRRVGRDLGGVSYLQQPPVFVSARRFAVESITAYASKCVLWAVLRLLGSPMNLVGYRWMRYPPHLSNSDAVPDSEVL